MRLKSIIAVLSCLFVSGAAMADLEPWKDYTVSDAVWSITTVKVQSNMGDAYLEGLRETWVSGNKVSKDLGQIEDWWIYRSDLEESGDFNLLLVVKFANTAALAPNKANYDKFMAKFTKAQSDKTSAYAQKNYPGMRDLTGEYQMRLITIK
jgi:hypothetical protein